MNISASFTAVGDKSGVSSFEKGQTIQITLSSEAETYGGTVVLEKSKFPGSGCFSTVKTMTEEGTFEFLNEDAPIWYRLSCSVVAESETITAIMGLLRDGIDTVTTDASGLFTLSRGTLANLPTGGAGYAVSAIYACTDVPRLYVNIGTVAVASWRQFGVHTDDTNGENYTIGFSNGAGVGVEV